MELKYYMQDGACTQARCVLAFLQRMDIEESWNDSFKCYEAKPEVGRWENCREQGYVVMLRNKKYEQLNIAFFEHRNTDGICAIRWIQSTINSPTIETAQFGDVYKDKYDVSHSVGYHEFQKMSDWIFGQMKAHWFAGLADTNK
jgi:hypothetical protein